MVRKSPTTLLSSARLFPKKTWRTSRWGRGEKGSCITFNNPQSVAKPYTPWIKLHDHMWIPTKMISVTRQYLFLYQQRWYSVTRQSLFWFFFKWAAWQALTVSCLGRSTLLWWESCTMISLFHSPKMSKSSISWSVPKSGSVSCSGKSMSPIVTVKSYQQALNLRWSLTWRVTCHYPTTQEIGLHRSFLRVIGVIWQMFVQTLSRLVNIDSRKGCRRSVEF